MSLKVKGRIHINIEDLINLATSKGMPILRAKDYVVVNGIRFFSDGSLEYDTMLKDRLSDLMSEYVKYKLQDRFEVSSKHSKGNEIVLTLTRR